ncbi:MAG: DUF2062 domain-containing protein [Gammaproteobacteria bacterium]|nr:MAG: DUF2062 domain-containing protein [Gammaproteobacteria bacterium]RLA53657.1 MAG: DUF2062 domain-containing protein [Gammaproteobacteria bacterium]
MPRKTIRRLIPLPSNVAGDKTRRWLGPLFDDPNLMHLNRHSVSGAVFIGLFCAFLPLPGQAIVASLLALLFSCNLPISVLLIWISNPITIPPMMILLYELGRKILGTEQVAFEFELSWNWFAEHSASVYLPVAVGGLLAGLCVGFIGYVTVQGLWRWKVVKNWEERKEKRLRSRSQ